MDLEASKIDGDGIIVEWEGEDNGRYDVFVDDVLVRGNTSSHKHSVDPQSNEIIRVVNKATGDSGAMITEKDSKKMYEMMKTGTIDLSGMGPVRSRLLKEFVVSNGTSGDLLKVDVRMNSTSFQTEARLVKNGDTVRSSDNDRNIYLPFGFSEEDQVVVFESGENRETLHYDVSTKTLKVDDSRYGFGDSFVLGGRRVALAEGSVVIIMEDSLPLVFPQDGVQQEITVESGTVVSGSMMAKSFIQVKQKESRGNTEVNSYVFSYDPETDERLGVSQIERTVDDAMTSSECTWKTVNTEKVLNNTLKYGPSEVSIESASGSVISTSTVNNTGLSFSSDESSIFFGPSCQFKISYDDGKVLVQHLDSSTGTYVTKTQFEQ